MILPPTKKNRRYGVASQITHITIHETGNTNKGANAKAHANYLNSTQAEQAPVSWHFTVDDKDIVQHLPENESGYHAGDGGQGHGNRHTIGIEICVNQDGNFNKAMKNAAELCAYLMSIYDININNVLQHYDWSGKNCPENMRANDNKLWKAFIAKIIDFSKNKIEEVIEHVPAWGAEAWQWATSDSSLQISSPPYSTPNMLQVAVLLHALWRDICNNFVLTKEN